MLIGSIYVLSVLRGNDVGVFSDYWKWYLCLIWGYAVAQLVGALRYKPEGRGFDS